MKYISPTEVQTHLEDYFIIDIREKYEYDFANIGSHHIPMNEVSNRIKEFHNNEKVVLMCKSGKRAEAVANLLETEFLLENIYVMEGGLLNWAQSFNPDLILE